MNRIINSGWSSYEKKMKEYNRAITFAPRVDQIRPGMMDAQKTNGKKTKD